MKFADVSKENLTGIYIPSELAANTTLNWTEKAVYSIYHYFTYYGQSHCCRLTNDIICERLGIKERSLQRIKKDLTNNGYITVNGITVKALKEFAGVTLLTPIANEKQRGDTFDTHSEQNAGVTLLTPIAVEQPRVTKMVARGDTFDTHNKENKDNKECSYYISDSNYNEDRLNIQDVNILKSDSHQSENDNVNINPLGGFEIVPDVPEWMKELEPVEPFEQYTDDIQGEAMEKATNNTSKTDERENKQTMKQQTTNNPSKTKSWKNEIDAGYTNREQVQDEHRAEARKWYWTKWNAFLTTLNERDIEDNNEWFKWFRTRLPIVTDEKYYDEKYNSIKTQYQHLFNQRWWDEWNELVSEITDNPQGYLACTRRYADKAEHLQNLLKQMLKGDELSKHRLAAELKYRNATQPLLQTIKYEDPDTIGKDNSDFGLEFGIPVETYNPSVYDAATGAYYYTGE